jgi:hypothetical protein
MPNVGQREIETQRRVIEFLRDALGYANLGYWRHREENSHIEEALLAGWPMRQGRGEKPSALPRFRGHPGSVMMTPGGVRWHDETIRSRSCSRASVKAAPFSRAKRPHQGPLRWWRLAGS